MRRIAIGDVHGCCKNLMELLEKKVKITREDEVFLLGDIVSKGDASRETLEYVFNLLKEGFQVKAIRGNHEEKILMMCDDIELLGQYFEEYNLHGLLDGDFELYLSYFSSLPYFIKTGEFLLLHSEISFGQNPGIRDLRTIFGSKKLDDLFKIKDVELLTQVYGHLVRTNSEIKLDALNKEMRIGLDGGCVYPEFGYLFAMDLDSYECFYSKNEFK